MSGAETAFALTSYGAVNPVFSSPVAKVIANTLSHSLWRRERTGAVSLTIPVEHQPLAEPGLSGRSLWRRPTCRAVASSEGRSSLVQGIPAMAYEEGHPIIIPWDALFSAQYRC